VRTSLRLVGGPFDGGEYAIDEGSALFFSRDGDAITAEAVGALLPWSYQLVTLPGGIQQLHYTPPKGS
jgi:hypothetical protein